MILAKKCACRWCLIKTGAWAKPFRTETAGQDNSTAISIDGSVYLSLCATDGKGRVGMMVSPNGTGTLALQHKDGNPQMAFEVSPDGSLFHSFFDKRAVKRIQTTLMPDGNVGQRFYTTDGNGSASPAVLPDGSIGHAISGKDGKNQIVLMVNGQNNLVLGVMENGEPHALYNSSR